MATAVGDLVINLRSRNLTRGGISSALGSLKGFARSALTALAPISGAALFAGLLRSGEDFNRSMRSSLAIMGEVSDALQTRMRVAAFAAAKDTGFAASEMAKAYFYLASAGMSAEQSIAALPAVAKFARAGNFDLARATSLSADAQAALGLKSANAQKNLQELVHVTDVLTKANTLANANIEQFSEALTTKAGAALKIVNKDIEEGVAVLAAFAERGLKGSDAGTALHIVMRDLQTKAIENAKAFRRYGINVFDATGDMRNMADILADLENRLAGMSDAQAKATLLQLGFTDKSIAYTQSLIGTSDSIRKYEAALRQAGGTTQEVADKQLTPIQKGLAAMRSSFTELGSEIVTKFGPAIGGAFGGVSKMLDDITFTFRNFGDIAQLTMLNVVDAFLNLVPMAEKPLQKVAGVFVGIFGGIHRVVITTLDKITAALQDVSRSATRMVSGVTRAIELISAGEFEKASITIASAVVKAIPKRAISAGIEAAEQFQIGFTKGQAITEKSLRLGGGFKGLLESRRQEILGRLGKREAARTAAGGAGAVGETVQQKAAGAAGIETPGLRFAGAAIRGSQETASAILKATGATIGRKQPEEQTAKNTAGILKGIGLLNGNLKAFARDNKREIAVIPGGA